LAQFDLLERDTELAAVEALINASPGGGRLLAIRPSQTCLACAS